MKNRLVLFLAVVTLAGCAGDTKKDAALDDSHATPVVSAKEASQQSVSIEAKLAAAQENTSDVTEVRFEKGSRTLPHLYVQKIDAALKAAQAKSPVTHATVVVWSDSEMSKPSDPPLGEDAQKLATDRGEMLKALIHQKIPKLSLDIVNMAQKPGKIKRFLRTQDFRIQHELENAGEGDSKASHAIVIIETKQPQ